MPCASTCAFQASIAARFSASQASRRARATSAANPHSQAWEMLTFSAFASRNSASGKVILVARRVTWLGVSANVASILEATVRIWNAHFNLRHRSNMAPDPESMPWPPWSGLLPTATFLVAAMPVIAAPTACPPRADVTQQAQYVPDGFTPYVANSRHLLRGIGISAGPPNAHAPGETAWLLASNWRRQGRGHVGTWLFDPNEPPGIWVSCFYENTSIVLSFPLPLATKQCEVSHSEINIATGFTCK